MWEFLRKLNVRKPVKDDKWKDIEYTKGGVGHTEESFERLIDRNYEYFKKFINIDERIKIIKKNKGEL